MIAHWPAAIRRPGLVQDPCHVMDFMPTFCDLAGTAYPEEHFGRRVLPCEGRGFAPALHGDILPARGPLCWELNGCRAVRQGKWKLVSQGPPRSHVGVQVSPGGERWELYDMEADRSERLDLANELPGRVDSLAALWENWRTRCEGDLS
jgi:arylsulfatase